MPVTPVTYPIMPPVIVVTNSSPKKSEAEIMKANGGHIYFSVHLKHCEECRAEQERRNKESHNDAIIILGGLIGFTIFFIVCIQWFEIKEWFADKIDAYKARNNTLHDYERRASKLRMHFEEELRDVGTVNYSSVALLGEMTASNIPTIRQKDGTTYADLFKKHKRFFYHTNEATFYLFKRWTLTGWEHHAVRLGYYAHKTAIERLQNL